MAIFGGWILAWALRDFWCVVLIFIWWIPCVACSFCLWRYYIVILSSLGGVWGVICRL